MIAIWEMRFRNFQILLIHVLFTWTQSRNIFESCIVRLKSHNVTWLNPITNQIQKRIKKRFIFRSKSHIWIDTPAADKIITEPPLPQQLFRTLRLRRVEQAVLAQLQRPWQSNQRWSQWKQRNSGQRIQMHVVLKRPSWKHMLTSVYMSEKTVSALTSYKSFLSQASLQFLWVQWWTMIHDLVKR